MRLKRIWNDPVWSKVISAIIIWIGPVLVESFAPSSKLGQIASKYSLPNYAFAILVTLLVLFQYMSRRKFTKQVTSDEWLAKVSEKLEDCGSARIYLRDFAHPDNFKSEHRDILMKIMEGMKQKIKTGADIKIVSYIPNDSKSGVDWMNSEIKELDKVTASIHIKKNQPVSNSSTIYLFDDNFILYNRRKDGGTEYFVENFSNSIIHSFIKSGIDNATQAARA